MPPVFNAHQRSLRRDRAAGDGPELFLLGRAFDDCIERIASVGRKFDRALLIGCPEPSWLSNLRQFADDPDVVDPGKRFADAAGGTLVTEDHWEPSPQAYDLVVALGTLDTVNDLPLALRLIGYAMRPGALLLGAMSGGQTLPQLRAAMRAADTASGGAAPHVHPRIDASALAPLLTETGFANPVVDIDRVTVNYPSLDRLVSDLRAMAGTNVLTDRPRFIGKAARDAARRAFAENGDGGRTTETFEILHFAAWVPDN